MCSAHCPCAAHSLHSFPLCSVSDVCSVLNLEWQNETVKDSVEVCTSIANVRGVRVKQVHTHLALHTVHTVEVRTYVSK